MYDFPGLVAVGPTAPTPRCRRRAERRPLKRRRSRRRRGNSARSTPRVRPTASVSGVRVDRAAAEHHHLAPCPVVHGVERRRRRTGSTARDRRPSACRPAGRDRAAPDGCRNRCVARSRRPRCLPMPPRRTCPNWSTLRSPMSSEPSFGSAPSATTTIEAIPTALVTPLDAVTDLVDVERELGDEHDRRAAGDPGVGRDPAAVATHHLDDHHPVVALGGGVQTVDRVGGDLHRGVEAERLVGAVDVVVDRLRHADDRQTVVVVRAGRRRVSEPLPPTTISASMPMSASVALISSTPPGRSNGLPRRVPMHGAATRAASRASSRP